MAVVIVRNKDARGAVLWTGINQAAVCHWASLRGLKAMLDPTNNDILVFDYVREDDDYGRMVGALDQVVATVPKGCWLVDNDDTLDAPLVCNACDVLELELTELEKKYASGPSLENQK